MKEVKWALLTVMDMCVGAAVIVISIALYYLAVAHSTGRYSFALKGFISVIQAIVAVTTHASS